MLVPVLAGVAMVMVLAVFLVTMRIGTTANNAKILAEQKVGPVPSPAQTRRSLRSSCLVNHSRCAVITTVSQAMPRHQAASTSVNQ